MGSRKDTEDKAQPFDGRTQAYAKYTKVQYGQKLHEWFLKQGTQDEVPNEEQVQVLQTIGNLILEEIALAKEGSDRRQKIFASAAADPREEPLLGLVLGLPGTGKSRVIAWIRSMFMEVFEWEHGVEFQCVAFQNRVALSMGGETLHTAGDIGARGYESNRQLTHTDIDPLFSRNQHLRWILIDECGMIPDELLGVFANIYADAARDTRYKRRTDGSSRIFGGYNVLASGDFLQLPPIPSRAAVFLPAKVRELWRYSTSFGDVEMIV